MKKIIILTGNELRHKFFRIYLGASKNITVLKSYCENGATLVSKISEEEEARTRTDHLKERQETEIDFFRIFTEKVPDNSNFLVIQKGEINHEKIVAEIENLNPDLIISYGCSIIKSRLLETYKNRFLNLHLGLSPYYRGSGTNFWPVVNQEPGFIGATFMYIDQGIDTGKIIHQIRADIHAWDTIHTLGNRLIRDAAYACERLIESSNQLVTIPDDYFPVYDEKYYKNRDFTEEAVMKAYQNLENGLFSNYLKTKSDFMEKHPIFSNPGLMH